MSYLAEFSNDLRFALRTLQRHPVFTLVALATLALGIGANATIFSVTQAALLRPLPFRDPDRLVRLMADSSTLQIEGAGLALGDFVDLRQSLSNVEGVAAYSVRGFDYTAEGEPEVVQVAEVSPSLFPLLGVKAAEGRTFLPQEEAPGREGVVILSDGFWHRRFSGSPIGGKTLKLDGRDYQVIGVMRPGFRFPNSKVDLWVPLALPAGTADRMSHYLAAVARLRPGATLAQVNADSRRIAANLAATYPDSNEGWTVRAVNLSQHMGKRVRPALLVLTGAVGLLLLIACSNLANLILARGASRFRETAIRSALGARTRSLIRLFLVESFSLSLIGGLLGLALAAIGVQAVLSANPIELPRLTEIAVNGPVIAFALVLAVLSALLFGAIPAFQLARPDLNESAKTGELGARKGQGFRSSLVVAEIALSLVLLTGASLLFRGFLKLTQVDPGFDSSHAVALQLSLAPTRYPDDTSLVGFAQRLQQELSTLPGVRSAAIASSIPMLPDGQNLLPFEVEGRAAIGAEKGVHAQFSAVTPGFFQTLRIPLKRGRIFGTQDVAGKPAVVIINEELERRFFPNESPIGKRLSLTVRGDTASSYEVVGVVGSVRQTSLAEGPELGIYTPFEQVPHSQLTAVLQSQGNPTELMEPAQRRVYDVDPDQPIARTLTLDQVLVQAGSQTRFLTALLGLFAAIGLLLAAVGIYGIIAYSVSRRRQEIAIRMAVGAAPHDILWLVIGGGLKVAVAGILIGLVGAFGLSGMLKSLLYGLGPRDPSSFMVAPALLFAVALLASYLPARRAVRVDPVSPLRQT